MFRHGYESFQKCYSATCTKHFDRVFYKMAGAGSVVRCSKNNLFIQYSAGVSMNKHTGYIYSGNDNAFPPAGFSTVQKIMFRKPADKSGVLGALGDLVRRCESSLDGRPRDRCVVIGQDAGRLNSVVAGKYVDIYGITKIRVN